ncbi:MAG: hydroxymethylglutaryl-CoA lyase [Desulfococcaceae bacterium]|nr:hydroxymethylglutaryl-CoA lyase [Desulfococcaceae bacterium]
MTRKHISIIFPAMYPKQINLIEVGPRDGFQSESRIIPTDIKLEIIAGLAAAGISQIQVASFVSPKRVPQMADAEALIQKLPENDSVVYTGLALNPRGVERAQEAGLKAVEISISASDSHSRKNAGMSRRESLQQGRNMARLAKQKGMHLIAGIQCAFGCVYDGSIPAGNVLDAVRMYCDEGIDRLSLADTTGMAAPLLVKELVGKVKAEAPGIPLGLHLHDTRGLGLVNLMAGLESGIRCFDTAFGGLGGCPFVKGAAGNIATEDSLYLLESLHIESGIDRRKVAECSRKIAGFLQRRLPGKLYASGL